MKPHSLTLIATTAFLGLSLLASPLSAQSARDMKILQNQVKVLQKIVRDLQTRLRNTATSSSTARITRIRKSSEYARTKSPSCPDSIEKLNHSQKDNGIPKPSLCIKNVL